MQNRKIIITLAVLLTFGTFGVTFAAPLWTFQTSLLPQTDNAFDLGTTTGKVNSGVWRNLYVSQICLSTDCKSAWPAGGSGSPGGSSGQIQYNGSGSFAGVSTSTLSAGTGVTFTGTPGYLIGGTNLTINATGGSGSGNVSTSTNETPGSLAYWTSTSATPALLGKVATSSLTLGTEFANSGTTGFLVGGTNGTLTLAANGTPLTKLATIGAFTILGNNTNATGNVVSFATSTLNISLNDVRGVLTVAKGGTNNTNALSNGKVIISNADAYVESAVTATQLNLLTSTFPVANGGTGAATLTGVLKGNGTSPFTAAANGTDYTLITAKDCTGTGHILSITAAGVSTCSADSGGGSSFGYPFTNPTSFGTTTAATTTPLWAQMGIYASSTSQFVNASTSALSILSTGGGILLPAGAFAAAPTISSPGFLTSGIYFGSTGNPVLVSGSNNTIQASGAQATILAGTASAPALVFSNDPQSGFWRPATGIIALSTATTEKWRTDTFGTGIGTTSPAWTLDVASSTRSQLGLSDGSKTSNHWTLRNAGGNLYFATSSPTTFATSSMSAFTIDSNGRLGIGTTSPGTELSIGNTGANSINLSTTATSTFGSGININTGCFAIGGTCVGAGSANSTNTTSAEMTCDTPEATSTRFFMGGAWIAPVVASNTPMLAFSAPTFGAATSSAITCTWNVPLDLAATPAAFVMPVYVSTSTNKVGVMDIDGIDISDTGGLYDPIADSFTNVIAASTTAAQRIATPVAPKTATTSQYSLSGIPITAGHTLYLRFTRWGGAAADTVKGDLYMPHVKIKYDHNVN